MCGRYTLTLEGSMVADWFDFEPSQLELAPKYNIAPTRVQPGPAHALGPGPFLGQRHQHWVQDD
jgi:hypothetical protein